VRGDRDGVKGGIPLWWRRWRWVGGSCARGLNWWDDDLWPKVGREGVWG